MKTWVWISSAGCLKRREAGGLFSLSLRLNWPVPVGGALPWAEPPAVRCLRPSPLQVQLTTWPRVSSVGPPDPERMVPLFPLQAAPSSLTVSPENIPHRVVGPLSPSQPYGRGHRGQWVGGLSSGRCPAGCPSGSWGSPGEQRQVLAARCLGQNPAFRRERECLRVSLEALWGFTALDVHVWRSVSSCSFCWLFLGVFWLKGGWGQSLGGEAGWPDPLKEQGAPLGRVVATPGAGVSGPW